MQRTSDGRCCFTRELQQTLREQAHEDGLLPSAPRRKDPFERFASSFRLTVKRAAPVSAQHEPHLLGAAGLRRARDPGEDHLVLQQRARPAGEEEADRPAPAPTTVSPACRRVCRVCRGSTPPSTCRSPGCGTRPPPTTSGARMPRSPKSIVLRPVRDRARRADRGRGTGDRRGVLRRARGRRGGNPALPEGLLGRRPARAPQARRAARVRRGRHRIRPARHALRGGLLRIRAGHDDDLEGPHERLHSPRRQCPEREGLGSPGGRLEEVRAVLPRLSPTPRIPSARRWP